MAWKNRAFIMFLTLILIGHGASYGQADESVQDLSPFMRLVYCYDPHSVDQVKQLETLRMLAEGESEPIEVQGLISHAVPTSEVKFTPASSAFWSVEDACEDYAVLLTKRGQIRAKGSGTQMEWVLQSLPKGPISTDIDESTWGKVKELFQ
tara:strand:- start:673 stop:1125 length:453 start_codon:yes stop_codon:yes gene_type:complete